MKISVTSSRLRQCAHAARRCRAGRWASAVGVDAAGHDGAGARACEEPAVPETTQGQEVAGLTSPDAAALDAQLEQAGATIREINVTVDNVFDPSNPKEDKALYRWANKVHVRTHDSVIESALLFGVGDRYEARVLDESARALRGRGYLADVKIGPESYDPVANTVAVDVRVRDSWTLAPEIKFSHRGGQSEWALGLDDKNLFGTGKQVQIIEKSLIDRDETLLSYGDPNLLGSRVRLNAGFTDASDGYRHSLAVERPFYSLDTRWMLGGNLLDEQRVDPMYDLGEEIDEFGHDLKASRCKAAGRAGSRTAACTRWLVRRHLDGGRVLSDHRHAAATAAAARTASSCTRGSDGSCSQDDYREMSELNDIGRTEDVALGTSLFVSVGFADTSYGSDRDATLLRATFQKGWEPGGPAGC